MQSVAGKAGCSFVAGWGSVLSEFLQPERRDFFGVEKDGSPSDFIPILDEGRKLFLRPALRAFCSRR
jgi:hypothetical protein